MSVCRQWPLAASRRKRESLRFRTMGICGGWNGRGREQGIREQGIDRQRHRYRGDFDRRSAFQFAAGVGAAAGVARGRRRVASEARIQVDEHGFRSVFPWSWAAHPLFAVEAGDRHCVAGVDHVAAAGRVGRRTAGQGRRCGCLADCEVGGRSHVDLSVADAPDSGIGDKLFAGPLSASENWCALERPSAGLRIRVTFDAVATPYLGLWICYGGWPERPGPKQMCVALEPATAPVDSLAVTGEWSRVLEPGESFSWPMEVEIERIER